MRNKIVIGGALLAVVLGVVFLCLPRDGEVASVEETENSAPTKNAIVEVRGKDSGKIKVVRTKPVLNLSADDEDEDDEVKKTPAEKKLAQQIEKALDEEDLALAKACAKDAANCRVTEIRQAMVDTLGWFGKAALAELLPFMADADSDVAESAQNEWEMGVSEIEDDAEKLGMVSLVMGVMKDEDFLESISGEYIGVDEKLAVESLLQVIEGGGSEKGIAKAKETYEFVTGEEFVDRAAAEKWVAEEYEPPEGEHP